MTEENASRFLQEAIDQAHTLIRDIKCNNFGTASERAEEIMKLLHRKIQTEIKKYLTRSTNLTIFKCSQVLFLFMETTPCILIEQSNY